MLRILLIFMLPLMFLLHIACDKRSEPVSMESLPEFDTLWNYADPAATEQAFRKVLDEHDLSQASAYRQELMSQIARTLGLQQRFDDAHALLDSLDAEIGADAGIPRLRALLERGRVLNSSGRAAESIAHFQDAFALAKKLEADFYAVDAVHMLAIVTPPEEQLRWSDVAMELAEKSSDQRAKNWLGPLYNNSGWSYHDLGNYEKALELFQKSLAWRVEQQQPLEIRIAQWCIARTYRSLGRLDEALLLQQKLLNEIEMSGADEDGYIHEEIGECLLEQGKAAEAAVYFSKAWELLSQDPWLQRNEAPRLDRLKTLGQL